MFSSKIHIKIIFFLFIIVGAGTLDSCSDYNKILKGDQYDLKYEKAYELYKEGKHLQALSLFEQVLPKYKLTPKGEDIYYHYAYCYWFLKDYYLAGFYFKQFVKQYPNSRFAEECSFLNVLCNVRVSPEASLDQTDTYTALDEIQLFIDEYPLSSRIDTCNAIMDKLRAKLEVKLYNYGKLYYKMGNYKASYTALKAALQQFPTTKFKEEMLFMMLNSAYRLAENSVAYKKLERYEETIKVYHKFAARFPDSKYKKSSEKILEDTKFQITVMQVYTKIGKVRLQKKIEKRRELYTELTFFVADFNKSHNSVKTKNLLNEALKSLNKEITKDEKKLYASKGKKVKE